MLYQLISDIHLEFCNGRLPKINKISENLILAGDIGVISDTNILKKFLQECCSKWTRVFYVLGNHEYYRCNNMISSVNRLKNYTMNFLNFHLLNNDYFILDNTVIYGFTGWTTPTPKIREYSYNLNDFTCIKNFTINDMENLSKEDIDKFKLFIDEINSNNIKCENVIIVTHFPPIKNGTSDPKYIEGPLADYYRWNNLLESNQIVCDKIKIWCSGHTHWSYDFIINGIRYISNQYGYPSENLKHEDVGF